MKQRVWRGLDLTDADEKFRERFWAKVDKSGEGCWEWTAYRAPAGYGQFAVHKRDFFGAHVVSFALTFGPVPPGRVVCHRCDNPPCCNPDHLFLGTQSDNAIDMFSKGRASRTRGTERANARLNEDAVRRIRTHLHLTTVELASEYGVSAHTISDVRRGKKWRHVT